MIPKIIHYCWFGRNPMPKEFQKYIKTWNKFCPDYEIKLWNEDNYDVNKNPFMAEAYRQKKWAFVTDYARVDVIYRYGGIYLDTDVELLKPLDNLLGYKGFAGFQYDDHVAFGLGFGAEAHNPLVKEIMDFYNGIEFNEENMKKYTCPVIQTTVLEKHGLKADRTLEQEIEGFHVFPTEYFCPMNYYTKLYDCLTDNSYSIHHFAASWFSKKQLKEYKRQIRKIHFNYYFRTGVKNVLKFFHLYETARKIKKHFKKGE